MPTAASAILAATGGYYPGGSLVCPAGPAFPPAFFSPLLAFSALPAVATSRSARHLTRLTDGAVVSLARPFQKE